MKTRKAANKYEARQIVRDHIAAYLRNMDMGAVADLDDPLVVEVFEDECKRCAARITPRIQE